MGGQMSALHASVQTITCPKKLTSVLNNGMGLDLDESDQQVLALALKKNGGKGLTMDQIERLVDTKTSVGVLGGGDGQGLLETYFTKAEMEADGEGQAAMGFYGGLEAHMQAEEHSTKRILGGGGGQDYYYNEVSLLSDDGSSGGSVAVLVSAVRILRQGV